MKQKYRVVIVNGESSFEYMDESGGKLKVFNNANKFADEMGILPNARQIKISEIAEDITWYQALRRF